MTGPQELIERLRNLGPRERVIYFIGFLDELRARRPVPSETIIANIAYELSVQGKVILVQRRLSMPVAPKGGFIDWKLGIGRGFEYWAIGAAAKEIT